MGAKKKGKKGKKGKKKDKKPKIAPKLVIPNFIPTKPIKSPLSVIVHHLDTIYVILGNEYDLSVKIKEELAKIIKRPIEEIKLFQKNKRPIEDDTTNHDQQIINKTELYLVLLIENNVWEKPIDIINYGQ